MSDKNEAAVQHDIIGAREREGGFVRTTHPDAQWFGSAGLGLFAHWGIASVFGNTDLSWGMMADWVWDAPLPGYPKVTPRQYYEEGIARFHPDKYDPRRWLEAAAKAGVRYAVLTTKHHDGYTLFPSEFGEIGVRQCGGTDLVGPFAEACRECGLKVGLYYSPPDWYFNRKYMKFNAGSPKDNKPPLDFDLNPMKEIPAMPPEHMAKYRELIYGQTKELLTNYGKVDIIWFDGRGVPENAPDPVSVEQIRAWQPGIVINPRMHGKGDFSTPECSVPEKAPEGWWEVCHLINDHGWGYTVHPYKSFEWIMQTMLQIRSMGGNFLMNAGPMPSGDMPREFYERMSQIAEWMKDPENRAKVFHD